MLINKKNYFHFQNKIKFYIFAIEIKNVFFIVIDLRLLNCLLVRVGNFYYQLYGNN